jgi:hypothetical protein
MILNSKVHACRSFIEVALADSVCFTYNLDLAPEIYLRRPAKEVALYARLSTTSIVLS